MLALSGSHSSTTLSGQWVYRKKETKLIDYSGMMICARERVCCKHSFDYRAKKVKKKDSNSLKAYLAKEPVLLHTI